MWYLQKQNGDRRIYLKPLVEIIIGRKRGDLLIPDDESISKTHASICVQPKSDIRFDQPISACIIKDEQSRYGTYIIKENHKIEIGEEGYEMRSQDVIRFGLQNSLFTVTYIPVISVISTLNDEDKSTLQNLMDQIDGVISTEWTNNCTHLTVSKATLTEKVTWALASAIPIVTIDYWIAVQRAVTNNQELPSPDNYVPPIGESLVDKTKLLLHPNNKRKTLFSNLIFVHFSMNQYKIYGKMIHLAGGRSVLFSKKPLTPKELCSPNVIVLQYPGDDTTQSTQHIVPEYDSICKALQEHRRKMIPEFEIPLAILHCSVEKYCNPKFRFTEFLKISETRPETRPERSKVIIIDTQDVDVGPSTSNANLPRSKQAVKIIPETNDSFSSQDLTCTSLKGLVCSTPVKNNNKLKSNFNVIATESIKQDAKAQHSKENVCIPETCDSFASNATSMDLQSSTQNSVILRNDKKTENSQSLTSPTIASVKPRIKEIIDISQEDDIFEKIQLNTKKTNERLNKVLASKRTSNLKTNSSPVQPNPSKIIEHLSEVSVFKKSDTLSKTNESPIRKTPIENLKENSQESAIVVCSSDEDSVGFNESNTAKSNTNEIKIIDKNVRGNASDCCKGSMDDDTHRAESSISRFNKCSKKCKSPVKRTVSYDSVAEISVQKMSSTSRAEHEDSISNNTNRQHQTTVNFKRFKKAPVIIPKKRIGLSNMYVWQKDIA